MSATLNDRYMEFRSGPDLYALPLLNVREVIAVPETTPIPFAPSHFKGIMNLRGQIISVIDLRLKLGQKTAAGSENAVIICLIGQMTIGMIVDSVESVLTVDPAHVAAKPEGLSAQKTNFIQSVYKRDGELLLFVDIAKLLDVEDYKVIQTEHKAA